MMPTDSIIILFADGLIRLKNKMKKREFNKYLNQIINKKTKLIDIEKIKDIPLDVRDSMVRFIVRNRQPIIKELIPELFDRNWLASMGYLYETKGKYFTFIHTCEHRIK